MVELQLGEFDIHQVLRGEIVRNLEVQTLRVDDRHDGHPHLCVRKVNAADATIVRKIDLEEILVTEFGPMAGWLKRCHSELVLLRNLLNFALLLLCVGNLVLDLLELKL